MTVYLVRHAKAGSRNRWKGPDEARPLSKTGQRQASDLAEQLGGVGIGRVLTSGYVRCRDTVAPLAAQLGVRLEITDALAEGAPVGPLRALVLEEGALGSTVLCTHGDVIGLLLDELAGDGLDLGSEPALAKGSFWALDVGRGAVTRARYRGPRS